MNVPTWPHSWSPTGVTTSAPAATARSTKVATSEAVANGTHRMHSLVPPGETGRATEAPTESAGGHEHDPGPADLHLKRFRHAVVRELTRRGKAQGAVEVVCDTSIGGSQADNERWVLHGPTDGSLGANSSHWCQVSIVTKVAPNCRDARPDHLDVPPQISSRDCPEVGHDDAIAGT